MTKLLEIVTECLSGADKKKLLQRLGLKGILDREELVIFLKDNLLFKECLGDGESIPGSDVTKVAGLTLTRYEDQYYKISNDYSGSIDWWYYRLCILLSYYWPDVKISS